MVRSMTAYASGSTCLDTLTIYWELRSVNHRYLDLNFKLPDYLHSLEPLLRDYCQSQLFRGKLDCFLRLEFLNFKHQPLDMHTEILNHLIVANESVVSKYPHIRPLSVADILKWPSLIQEKPINWQAFQAPLMDAFTLVLEQLVQCRIREGEKLRALILMRLDKISTRIEKIRAQMPALKTLLKQNFLQKLILLDEVEPKKKDAIIASLLLKLDVSEEIDRIDIHLKETARILDHETVMGRRLDFLMQELQREANTLAVKISFPELASDLIDLKVWIEEMREQIQNIE